MTELYPVDALPGASGKAGRMVSRPNQTNYHRYDLYYENPSELFATLKYGDALEKLTRRELFWGDERVLNASKPLRNPVHRVVEFYATTMLTGTAKEAFPFKETKDAVRDAILKKWADSNMDALKQVLKRLTAKHGLCFAKACMPNDLPAHAQEIKAEHVTDYSKDPRGHIDYIRLDIPVEPTAEELADPVKANSKWTETEVWRKGTRATDREGNVTKKAGYFRKWRRERDPNNNSVLAEVDLGAPQMTFALTEDTSVKNSLGFDFVPFVDFAAAEDGQKWPRPVWAHVIPLVEEANRMATRYSDLLFLYNKPHRAIVGIGNDPSGRPYPPPEAPGQNQTVFDEDTVPFRGFNAAVLGSSTEQEGTLDGDIWFGAPGNARIEDVTPNIEFEAQRRALLDTLEEIRREAPELVYYEILTSVPDSSRAVRLLMRGAIERSREMQSNIENSVIKLDKMLLTMAQIKGEDGFSNDDIGSFEDGEGFEHSFEAQEIVETSDIEKQEVLGRQIANLIALVQFGYTREQAAELAGLSKLAFAENAPEGPPMNPEDMSVGTGGNPSGGVNLENAAARVSRGLTGPTF